MSRSLSDLNLLMLSLATDILTEPLGDARERHAEYAEYIGHLHIVIYAPRHVGRQPVEVTDRFTAYPSASASRYLFPLDAYRVGRRLIASHPVGLLATQDPFTTGITGVWLKRRAGIPLQVNNHSTFFDNPHWLRERPLRHRVFERLGRYVVRQANTLRTVNGHQRDRYVEMGIDPSRIEVINTPIRLERFLTPPDPAAVTALRERLEVPEQAKIVLWVGRPSAANPKRLPDLLSAFAQVRRASPDAHLVLAGDMRGASYVQRHVERLGLDESVRCPGAVSHADLPLYYALADVFALSSVYEGMPKVLVEAAASSTPAVSTRIPGVRDVVVEGETGLLCQPENPTDLADKLLTLLNDPQGAAAMGERARAYVQRRFDRGRTMSAIADLWARAAFGEGAG